RRPFSALGAPGRARLRRLSCARRSPGRPSAPRAARRTAAHTRARRVVSSPPRPRRALMPPLALHLPDHALPGEGAGPPPRRLPEFVAPHFATGDTDAAARTIVLTIDAREHARLASQGPHPERHRKPCFTLDSAVVSGRVWSAPPATEILFDEELDTFYRHTQ